MRYIEKDAFYRVCVPDEWPDEDALRYKKYWDGKVVQVSTILHSWVSGSHTLENTTRGFNIPVDWLAELVRHCPQVENFIKTQIQQIQQTQQIQEKYVSPFSGEQV